MLTQEQKEILTGLMLGDGHLSKLKGAKNVMLEVTRVITDQNYIYHHQKIFSEFLTDKAIYKKETFDERTKKTYYSIRLRTRAKPEFTEFHNKWYRNKVKILPDDLELTPLVIATWLADDGCVRFHNQYGKVYDQELRINIATNGFSHDEVKRLREMLFQKYNFYPLISKSSGKHVLEIVKKADVKTILAGIDKSFPPGMERKSDKWRQLYGW